MRMGYAVAFFFTVASCCVHAAPDGGEQVTEVNLPEGDIRNTATLEKRQHGRSRGYSRSPGRDRYGRRRGRHDRNGGRGLRGGSRENNGIIDLQAQVVD